jgi:Sap-like sulfolipid-1-addressing protein
VIAQAAGFAILAALSPTALLVMAVFLGSDRPRETALAYVAGAVIMTVVMAVTVLLVLRGIGLNQPRERSPRYGLRLGLGVIALAAAVVLLRRGLPQPGDPDQKQKQGLIGRLTARPRPGLAFAAGLILFLPSATFVAAVQVVATANASTPAIALALIAIVAISALIVWLPLLAFLVMPDATVRRLRMLNGWLRAHGRTIAVYGLLVGGIVLIINGSLGVARR